MKSIIGAATIFLFLVVLPAPRAHAYAIGSDLPVAPTTSSLTTIGVSGGSYDVGSSLQNLVSPFTGFVDSLKLNGGSTTVNASGVGFSWPTVNMTPVLEGTFQNTLSQWFSEFGAWFYSVTGVQLSGIMLALLNLFSWVLGLAQQVINWLLGLFH